MKRWLLLAALIATPAAAQSVWVDGYLRSDGTYVPGHWRSAPNGSRLDNYSTQGNVNPYTGRSGSVNPYDRPYSPPRTMRMPSPPPPPQMPRYPVTPAYPTWPAYPAPSPYAPPPLLPWCCDSGE